MDTMFPRSRVYDLLRYMRTELLRERLITPEEYAALVADSENGQRVARLEQYDELRGRITDLETELAEARAWSGQWTVKS